MVIFRYLMREIMITMIAVAAVLLLVITGSRFIRYIASAAAGELPVGLVGNLMLFHFPGFIQLILPLAFFLGFLLAYSQLYLNSEMTVLQACGFSPARLLRIALWPGVLTAIAVGLCALWLNPAASKATAQMLDQQKSQLDFSILTPGRFQPIGSGRTAYIGSINREHTEMHHVFISEERAGRPTVLTRANLGVQYTDPNTGDRYLMLRDGFRQSIAPGNKVADEMKFASYAFLLRTADTRADFDSVTMQSSGQLWREGGDEALGELQFRLSLPLMIPVLALLAMSLSKVNPRHGRFAKLLPAIVLHVIYLSTLIAVSNAVKEGQMPAWIGVWPVHALFLLIGLWLLERTFGQRGAR
ncbi:LPS export ABC transporter permease LptF [Carnimonas nigrificans]|uniref:LPS export ABC transporter permease LptF n=1 Tax=Carnimonas nigrificans TaxID=64323 RepID=UPI00046F815F|nr:LPS export ABC transporter permease LptF [Carnimonas nigrificans]